MTNRRRLTGRQTFVRRVISLSTARCIFSRMSEQWWWERSADGIVIEFQIMRVQGPVIAGGFLEEEFSSLCHVEVVGLTTCEKIVLRNSAWLLIRKSAQGSCHPHGRRRWPGEWKREDEREDGKQRVQGRVARESSNTQHADDTCMTMRATHLVLEPMSMWNWTVLWVNEKMWRVRCADHRLMSLLVRTLCLCLVHMTIFLCVSLFSNPVLWPCHHQHRVVRAELFTDAEQLRENFYHEALAVSRHNINLVSDEENMKPERLAKAPENAGIDPSTMRLRKWYQESTQGHCLLRLMRQTPNHWKAYQLSAHANQRMILPPFCQTSPPRSLHVSPCLLLHLIPAGVEFFRVTSWMDWQIIPSFLSGTPPSRSPPATALRLSLDCQPRLSWSHARA